MYVGTQYFGTSKMEMEFLVRHGVTHFDARVGGYDVATLKRNREEAAEHGVELEMIHIPVAFLIFGISIYLTGRVYAVLRATGT